MDTPNRLEVELPQVTKQATPVFQTADERPSINLANLSSSPADSGIDHQTIDALLSRRKIPCREEASFGAPDHAPDAERSNVAAVAKCNSSKSMTDPSSGLAQAPDQPVEKLALKNSEAVVPVEKEQANAAPMKIKARKITSRTIAAPQEQDKPVEKLGLQETELISKGKADVPMNVRRTILNPATRGQSVQMLASKTLDAKAPALTNMAPPSLVPARNKPGDNIPVGVAGPWSRESFDLFGSWRPPGRESVITS
jgi:hypothetical protein